MPNSARTNLERRQYQQAEETERQHAEFVVRQQQELETKPRRDAEAAYADVARIQAEEFRNIIATTPLADDYLKSEGFILGVAKNQAQIDAAIEAFKYATPAFDYKNAHEVETLSGFFSRNDSINKGIPSNLKIAFDLLVEWGLMVPVETVIAAEQPAVPEPVSNTLVVVDLDAPLVTDPMTGSVYTERMLRLAPSTLELRLRRIIEHGHSGNERVDEYRERQEIIAARRQEMETPVHPSAQ